MLRVVELVQRGRSAGMFIAKIQAHGSTVNVQTFKVELDAREFLDSHDDAYFIRLMNKAGRRRVFSPELWAHESKTQINILASKYIFMKKNLSSEQAAAIQHYATENGAVPQLSQFPIVTFKLKATDSIVTMPLSSLVAIYKQDKDAASKTKAAEKRRLENELKWKPATGKFSS